MSDWLSYFPYPNCREDQKKAIQYAIDSFNEGKRFVVIEAATGVGKSAIGYTIANYMNNAIEDSENHSNGAWFVTTQKILQDQYLRDFHVKGMRSIKSSSNYTCKFKKVNTCADSQKELKLEEKDSPYYKSCMFSCVYRKEKEEFLSSGASVTNFPYLLTEANYNGKIKPRKILVIDEAHNIETELSKFVEIGVTDRFAKTTLKLDIPELRTQLQAFNWIKDVYFPKLTSHKNFIDETLAKNAGIKDKLNDFVALTRQIELLSGHHAKITRFLEIYDSENWVFESIDEDGKKSRRLQFKPIDVSVYAESILFRLGYKVLMMSATVLNKQGFCESLGITDENSGYISIASPFPVENRPILSFPIGKMTQNEIDNSLPRLVEAVKNILEQHKNEKGIIHCHSYKITNFLKKYIKSKRLLTHSTEDREDVLNKHLKSDQPTVLLSPSMTEGVDLVDDASRFQVICKIPYPYLGDKLVVKRMNRWKWWYPLQTAKTIVQSIGRSVRNSKDYAVTYILDSDWSTFYNKNKKYFPDDFEKCIK